MMKKNYLWMAAMASLLSFTACSDDASPLDNGQTPGEVVMDDGTTIELSVSNTGIGTRAARPMGSSAAANNVNKVQLKFYKSTDKTKWTLADSVLVAAVDGSAYKGSNNIINFSEKVTEGVPGSTDRREENKKIKLGGLVENTYYRIVAYGYNAPDTPEEKNKFPYAGKSGIQEDENIKGLFSTAKDHNLSGYNLEEVFAGYFDTPKATNASGKFTSTPRVSITRQVAGILAYFKIPTKMNNQDNVEKIVKTVKVFANDKSSGFKFPANLLEKTQDFNGIDDVEAQNGEELIVFDMSTAASNYQANLADQEAEYYTTGGDDKNGYTVPDEAAKGLANNYTKPIKLVLEKDAFFGARYILPYAAHVTSENGSTLKVVMYDTEDLEIKTLKVTTENIPTKGTKYNYDIRCNNFYSIGKKMASGNTEGKPDPENPDPQPNPDPDKPVDLGATDQIIVEIKDAWDVLHDMDVEE